MLKTSLYIAPMSGTISGHQPQPHLNGRYTAFGKVIEGMDVVDQIMIFDHITKGELIDLKN